MDDKFDLMYNVEAAQKLTEMELKADGIKEGIEQGKISMIIKMNEIGITMEDIAASADMSIEEIKKIINEHTN